MPTDYDSPEQPLKDLRTQISFLFLSNLKWVEERGVNIAVYSLLSN